MCPLLKQYRLLIYKFQRWLDTFYIFLDFIFTLRRWLVMNSVALTTFLSHSLSNYKLNWQLIWFVVLLDLYLLVYLRIISVFPGFLFCILVIIFYYFWQRNIWSCILWLVLNQLCSSCSFWSISVVNYCFANQQYIPIILAFSILYMCGNAFV